MSERTIRAWVAQGCPTAGTRPLRLDPMAVDGWRRAFRPDLAAGLSHGGRREGAGRKGRKGPNGKGAKGQRGQGQRAQGHRATGPHQNSGTPELRNSGTLVPIEATQAGLDRALKEGRVTAAALDVLRETIKVRGLLQEAEKESGGLLPAGDVEATWTRTLQALRSRLELLPARGGKRAAAELGLAARLEGPLRRILEEELAQVMQEVGGAGKQGSSEAGKQVQDCGTAELRNSGTLPAPPSPPPTP